MADPKDFIKAELRAYKNAEKQKQEAHICFDMQASRLCTDRIPCRITDSNPPRMWYKCLNKLHPFSATAGAICSPDVCPLEL